MKRQRQLRLRMQRSAVRGCASRGQTLAERARRMVAIAHPDFREQLARQARELLGKGRARVALPALPANDIRTRRSRS